MDTGSTGKQVFEFKAEMKQLLEIIVHSLYTHPEIFLRELISNASDALNKVKFMKLTGDRFIDPDAELDIRINIDSKKNTFEIEDTGIGMTREELVNNIGTIARSGTLEFVKMASEKNKAINEELIGRFGVGFYSVFMVTDEVVIETKHALEPKAYRWTSTGDGKFTVEEIEKKTRGTKIYFTLKKEYEDFSHVHKVREVINRYSNFADFPIFLENERVNKIGALWHRKKAEIKDSEYDEFYKFMANDFEAPLGHMHLSIEGNVNFKALIFIPKEPPLDVFSIENLKSLSLYVNKIMIQNDCKELLPEYMRFLKGIVDTPDLPLNVSRETAQYSPVMSKISAVIISEVLSYLDRMSKNEKEKYEKFYKDFGKFIKAGINRDYKNREKLIELLRFETTKTKKNEMISLKEYVARMKPEQKEIYYSSGSNKEAEAANPNIEYFKKNDIEVLLLGDPVDVFIMPSINDFGEKKIKSIDSRDIDLLPQDKLDKPEDGLSKGLLKIFKEVLKDKVEEVAVSKRLVDSPATLVSGKDGMDPQLERYLMNMQKGYAKGKRVMEVNTSHPLITNLSKKFLANPNDPILAKCILQLYDGALLMAGDLEKTGDFFKRMAEIMEEATK